MDERFCIVAECAGCDRITQMVWHHTGALVPVCSTYIKPSEWWRRGGCPFMFKTEVKKEFVRTGQQKQKRKK